MQPIIICATILLRYIPNGKNVVWDSRMAKENPDIAGNFLPYMWLGYVYKGLAWFSASDKNWSVDRKKAALELFAGKTASF